MIYSILALIVSIVVRILIGYLSGKYSALQPWVTVFTWVTVAIAVVAAVFIALKIAVACKPLIGAPRENKGAKYGKNNGKTSRRK